MTTAATTTHNMPAAKPVDKCDVRPEKHTGDPETASATVRPTRDSTQAAFPLSHSEEQQR
jgi:hypothetical protein